MANTVFQLRRNAVSGTRPTTTTVSPGELAINTTDGILFSANATGIFEIGGNLTSTAVGNSTSRFTVTTTSVAIGNSQGLIANGSTGTVNQVLTSNGSGVYWGVSGAGASPLIFTLDDISSQFNGAQTVFALTYSNATITSANVSPVDPNKLQIYIGSVLVVYNPNVYRYDYLNLTEFSTTNTYVNGTFNYGWYLSGTSNNIINFATPPLFGMSFDGFWRSDTNVIYLSNSSTYFTPLNIAFGA
jgi:hypothetical protein